MIKLNLSAYKRTSESNSEKIGENPIDCEFLLKQIYAAVPLQDLYIDLINYYEDSENPAVGTETHNLNIASHLLYTSIELSIEGKESVTIGAKIVAYLSNPYMGLGDCNFQYELLNDIRVDGYIIKSSCSDNRCLVLKNEAEIILQEKGETTGCPFYL